MTRMNTNKKRNTFKQQKSRVFISSVIRVHSCLFVAGFFLFVLTASAVGPATLSATTEPWRPVPGSEPGFGVLLSPGVVPCVVHVNGLRFPLAAGTPLSARYDWDFGDPAGKNNKLTGFNAAHFFVQPGAYTITLTVTDETGSARSATAHIVLSPDRRHAIFVSPGGSDMNVGTTPDAPLHSLGKAFKILPDSCAILLKAGNTYQADNTLKISHSDVVIGRYDEGADPVVMLTKQDGPKPPHGFISIDGRCNGVTIQNLVFDSPYGVADTAEAPKIGVEAIVARGRNISVLNCTFLNVDNAVNANGSPVGLLVEGCKAPLKTGVRAYFVWTQGSDFVCLDNTAANSTREHIVRLSGVQRALIFNNDFTNLDRRPADKYDTSKGTIEMHNGAYAYIAHNTVTGGTIRVGPLGLHEDPSTATDWCVIEDNQLNHTYIVAYPGAHHVMIRNNIIRNDAIQAIQLQAPDGQGRTNGDIQIFNNTVIDHGETGAFLKVWGHVNGIEMINNLLIAPHLKVGANGAAAVNVAEKDLSSFTAIGHNIWPKFDQGESMVNNKAISQAEWTAMPQVRQDSFAEISEGQKDIPTGEAVPAVVFDFDGHRRPAKPMIGAMEMKMSPATQPAAGNK
jgi:PKD repeat protein